MPWPCSALVFAAFIRIWFVRQLIGVSTSLECCLVLRVALLKISSFDEIFDSLLLIPSGTAFIMDGGWLLLVLM